MTPTANPHTEERTMTPTTITTLHERAEFRRAAQAMYARGQNDHGHLLSAVGAKGWVPTAQYDLAAEVYRAWLVFDEPKAQ